MGCVAHSLAEQWREVLLGQGEARGQALGSQGPGPGEQGTSEGPPLRGQEQEEFAWTEGQWWAG